ncbi:DUF402 domain-containing protein [bacterium]|nr:DUF402 domain-containing protein [bacterium]
MAEYVTEIKRHINKPDQTFRCEALARGPGHLVLRYVSDRTGRIGDVTFAPGSTTYAHYWEGRGYVAWRMHDPDGRLRGHVFHICRDVRIGAGVVDYRDMLLDIWVGADGGVIVLDEEEVRECAEKGLVSREDVAWIEGQRREVLARLEEIVQEIGVKPLTEKGV